MKNYSIVRSGSEYVVLAGEKCILKVASRRKAAKLVIVATGLLDRDPALPMASSITRDLNVIADPSEVP
jgi:hypothetical protein